jgi:F-type H+-transporting ATPase subunit epsilon
MDTIRLTILTPDAIAFDDAVEMLTFQSDGGMLGILPGHVPLITPLTAGELAVKQKGKERYLAVGDGLADIRGEQVTVLTAMAMGVESIDEVKAAEARAAAEAKLKERLSAEEVASTNAALVRALAQLRVKHRHR